MRRIPNLRHVIREADNEGRVERGQHAAIVRVESLRAKGTHHLRAFNLIQTNYDAPNIDKA